MLRFEDAQDAVVRRVHEWMALVQNIIDGNADVCHAEDEGHHKPVGHAGKSRQCINARHHYADDYTFHIEDEWPAVDPYATITF